MRLADVGSDHNSVIAEIKVKFEKSQNQLLIEENLISCEGEMITDDTVEAIWRSFKEQANKIMVKHGLSKNKPRNQKWMRTEILDLMEQRDQKNIERGKSRSNRK